MSRRLRNLKLVGNQNYYTKALISTRMVHFFSQFCCRGVVVTHTRRDWIVSRSKHSLAPRYVPPSPVWFRRLLELLSLSLSRPLSLSLSHSLTLSFSPSRTLSLSHFLTLSFPAAPGRQVGRRARLVRCSPG